MSLLEINLSEQKPVFFALMDVYGINKKTSNRICKFLGFSRNLKVVNLEKDQYTELLNYINDLNLTIGSDLRKIRMEDKNRHISIKSYKGLRKIKGLPVRGQRTHTNAKTARKNRNQMV